MSVVTRKRRENFAIIPNHVADDERLSFEARGVLCHLLAKPNDWRIHRKSIEKAGNIGRDKVLRILTELAEAGYLERHERRENGKIAGYDYTVYDSPMLTMLPFDEQPEISPRTDFQDAVEPQPENTDAAAPCTDLPDTVEPDTANTDAYKELIETNIPPTPQRFDALWSTWAIEHRPENRIRAEAMFSRLDARAQDAAIRLAGSYQRRCTLRSARPALITYLSKRAWEELDGAPPIDAKGRFVIKPEHRAEWSAWLASARKQFGEPGVESCLRTKLMLRDTRFPTETRATP